jgi:hypothetical protein
VVGVLDEELMKSTSPEPSVPSLFRQTLLTSAK